MDLAWCSAQLSTTLRMDLRIDPMRVFVPGPATGSVVKDGGEIANGCRRQPLLCVAQVTVGVDLQIAGCAHARALGATCAGHVS